MEKKLIEEIVAETLDFLGYDKQEDLYVQCMNAMLNMFSKK